MSKQFASRPSTLLGAHDSLLAWLIDQAVFRFGSYIDAKLSERTEKGKPKWNLDMLLADAERPYQGGILSMMMTQPGDVVDV
jgi:hypothetical protein